MLLAGTDPDLRRQVKTLLGSGPKERTGMIAVGLKLLGQIENLFKSQYVCAYEISSVHVVPGDNDKAAQWLVWILSEP